MLVNLFRLTDCAVIINYHRIKFIVNVLRTYMLLYNDKFLSRLSYKIYTYVNFAGDIDHIDAKFDKLVEAYVT